MRKVTFILAFSLLGAAASGQAETAFAIDRHGNFCFADTIYNRIVRVSSHGRTDVVARDVHSNVVACGDDGSIYFADGDSVWMRTGSGDLRKLFQASMIRRGLGRPLAIDRDGNSYFRSPDALIRITRDGFVTALKGRSDLVRTPLSTRGKDLYFLERPGAVGNHRIWRIDVRGRKSLVAVVANPTVSQTVHESGVGLCLRAKRVAAAYLVRLLRWSVA